MPSSKRVWQRETGLKRCIEIGLLALLCSPVAATAQGWSCASDEALTASVSAEERARISAEIARQRAWAEAMACTEAGRSDCPEAPDLTQPVVLSAGQ